MGRREDQYRGERGVGQLKGLWRAGGCGEAGADSMARMFTGLVQAVGKVASVEPRPAGAGGGVHLRVDPMGWGYRPEVGDSISVSGCCLTVAGLEGPKGELWAFDAVPETLAKTTLGGLAAGSRVNLEHAATPTTLLGGHVVQGHVDGVGVVESVLTEGEWRVRVRPPASLMEYMTPKGSVCLEGVSLTLARVEPREWFEVALIPVTLEKTTLGALRAGSKVNIEADAFAKTVVNWLKNYGSRS
jgi:riboflavin synthase